MFSPCVPWQALGLLAVVLIAFVAWSFLVARGDK